MPSLRIEVQQDNRRTRPTPFGGGTANGGAYTPERFEKDMKTNLDTIVDGVSAVAGKS